jgi:hypothetical protein
LLREPASRPASLSKDHENKNAASERRSHREAAEAHVWTAPAMQGNFSGFA